MRTQLTNRYNTEDLICLDGFFLFRVARNEQGNKLFLIFLDHRKVCEECFYRARDVSLHEAILVLGEGRADHMGEDLGEGVVSLHRGQNEQKLTFGDERIQLPIR